MTFQLLHENGQELLSTTLATLGSQFSKPLGMSNPLNDS